MHKREQMEPKKLNNNQSGLVSVTVTIVIMIVVTLIVSSFALIVRREQRRALDRQLSDQAYHAAEAGIADAQAALTAADTSAILDGGVNNCTGSDSFLEKVNATATPNPRQYTGNVSENVSYSCVLIDKTVSSWSTTSVAVEDGAITVPVQTTDPISKLRISWQGADNSTSFATGFDRPQNGSSYDSPMLRVTIFPFSGSETRDSLKGKAHTMFLTPIVDSSPGNAGQIDYVANNQYAPGQGVFVNGKCNAGNTTSPSPYFCNVDINGLSGTKNYVVIQPLYKTAKIDMQAYGTVGGVANTQLDFNNAQAEIDVTGKAADVLRRIRVRVPISEALELRSNSSSSSAPYGGLFPGAALSTTDSICKKWDVIPTPFSANQTCTTP